MKTRVLRKNGTLLLVTMAVALLVALPATAQDIKARMAARLPVIDDLKARGIVGENNQGYLEFVGAPEKAESVAAENADRRAVYAAIARQTGTSPEAVGRQRAVQIAQKSLPGVRLQKPDGTWYTK
ncbi:MAG: YdbL family protein [Desulfobacterales bacterium]|jgi:hypothetical protein|nr:YdbL family protein [Desulfobacteraceae bacterium]MDD3992741.1 YdbL family protein [Desulfobacteraceae bacterium]MDY0311992.1 YdbL family protein [Desulfobacterales bacterium]